MGICTNEGDNSKFIFATILPLFGLGIFSEILISLIHLFFLNSNVTRGDTFQITRTPHAGAKAWL